MRRRMKNNKTERWFWNGLWIGSLILVLSMGISKVRTGWPSIGSYRIFFIMSESMEPEIHRYQLVAAKRLSSGETLVPGEIYAYRKKGLMGEKIVIHRLNEVLPDGSCLFWGDANLLPDSRTVVQEDIGYRIVWY